MAFAIDFLPTISSCQAVSQINRAIARWGLMPVTMGRAYPEPEPAPIREPSAKES